MKHFETYIEHQRVRDFHKSTFADIVGEHRKRIYKQKFKSYNPMISNKIER